MSIVNLTRYFPVIGNILLILIAFLRGNVQAFGGLVNLNGSETIPEMEPFDDLATIYLAAFHGNTSERRVDALRQLQGRRQWYGGNEDRNNGNYGNNANYGDTRTVECLCEVTINGRHHVSGEVAVCGMTNRIQCPTTVGCQKAVATTTNGFVSIVKSCGIGNEVGGLGCRNRKEQAPYVDRISVLRCICMGRLCNEANDGRGGRNLTWLMVTSFFPVLFVAWNLH